jgi:hypothetical protein
VKLSAKFSYTSAAMNSYDYTQTFSGFVSKSLLSNFEEPGPIQGHHGGRIAHVGTITTITRTQTGRTGIFTIREIFTPM